MALPASGAISLSAVNTELSLSATAAITMNDAAVRTLFGVASGAITMNNGYGKSNRRGTVVTWPSNLAGGSTASAVATSAWTTNQGTYFPNGASTSFTLNITGAMQYGFPTTGTYLYTYLALGRWVGWNADGSPNMVYDIQYPLWSSSQAGSGFYMGGIQARQNNALTISNLLYGTALLNTNAIYNNTTDIRMTTSLPSGLTYNGNFNSTQQTITFTNYSGTDYYIGSWSGANGHWTPLEFGYYSQYNGFQYASYNVDNVGQTVYGQYLVETLTINGTAVSYTAPNSATQAQVIAGFKAAINAAGISGVSAVDQTNGLGIIGATSVTSAASSTVGASNYTPSIGSYGVF